MFAIARRDARVMNETYEDFTFTVLNFIGAAKDAGDGGPQAYLATVPPGKSVQSHFHPVNQFQVFFGSDGTYFERHSISGVHVQYADAYTPYGAFGAGDTQLSFFTLRAKSTSEHHTMPGAREKMLRPRGRSLQSPVRETESPNPVTITEIFEPQADGLAVYQLRIAAGVDGVAPSPQNSGGQYVVVVKGAMACHAGHFPYQSCLFLEPDDGPLHMSATSEECEVLILQFPRSA